jgi:hypothetical protein
MDDRTKVSRRVFFRGAATIAGAALAAGVIPIRAAQAQQKLAKDIMKYQGTPKDGQKCDDCQYFQAPKSCSLVAGDISPQGWCTAYNKKKS